jgi:squamous cell carcinoma antigen recognized by T-cells 3
MCGMPQLSFPLPNMASEHALVDSAMEESDSTTQLLTQITSLLTALEANPFSFPTHTQNIALNSTLDIASHSSSIQLARSTISIPPSIHLTYLRSAKKEVDLGDDDAVKSLVERCEEAEEDYFSVSLLEFHACLLKDVWEERYGEGSGDAVDEEETRIALKALAERAVLDTVLGHRVWDVYRDWELARIASHTGFVSLLQYIPPLT